VPPVAPMIRTFTSPTFSSLPTPKRIVITLRQQAPCS
jgi:hypothetical protein